MKEKYKLAYMDMAERFGQTSEATRLKVGAIIVDENGVISEGCNGTPSGWYSNVCEDINGATLPCVRHAEVNALNKLRRKTVSSVGASIFVSHAPCKMCSIEIVDSELKAVFYRHEYRLDDGIQYLRARGVYVEQIP
jgi:dCMP deaminase